MYEKIKKILLECGIEEEMINFNDFVSADILDSLTMAEIIISIEDLFGIEIDPEEIVPENFMNISTICEMASKYITKEKFGA